MSGDIVYAVFTKPWKDMGLSALGGMVKKIGFDGIELPVRPGKPASRCGVSSLTRRHPSWTGLGFPPLFWVL